MNETMKESKLDWALKYIKLGWHVIPIWGIKDGKCECGNTNCPENKWGKHPRTPHGVLDASNEEKQVIHWWTEYPNNNIAIHCGKSGIGAFDVDPRNGGNESFAQLTRGYGDLPTTVMANTGGGGLHFVFQDHKDFGLPLGFHGGGLDIKKGNAYIVVAPSTHKSGKEYEWVSNQAPWEYKAAPVPDFLIVPKEVNAPTDQEGKAKEDLEKLSGSSEVKGEIYTFKQNSNGTLQIVVNGQPSGAWIDKDGDIGSYKEAGPTAIQWLRYFGHEPSKAYEIAKKFGLSVVPGVGVVDPVGALLEETFKNVDFPLDVLPNDLKVFILRMAKAYNVLPDAVVVMVLTILSSAIGNSVRISPKYGWLEPPFLWSSIVGVSGSGKSPLQNKLVETINELQDKVLKVYLEELKQYEIKESTYQKSQRGKGDSTVVKPEKPKLIHYYTTDITLEALADILKTSPRGLVILQDELAGLIKGLNQYKGGKGNDAQKYLELWNCKPLKIDRVKSESCKYVFDTGCSILGGIQTLVLPSVFTAESFINGLIPRFLFSRLNVSQSDSTADSMSSNDMGYWTGLVNKLYDKPLNRNKDTERNQPTVLTFTDSSLKIYLLWVNDLKRKSKYLPEQHQVFVPKFTSYVVRISGILQVLRGSGNAITPDVVEDAIKIVKYFMGQAMSIIKEYGGGIRLSELERDVVKCLLELKEVVKNGKLRTSLITDSLNKKIPEVMNQTNQGVAIILKKLGLETKPTAGFSYLIWEEDKLSKLFLSIQSPTSPTAPTDSFEYGKNSDSHKYLREQLQSINKNDIQCHMCEEIITKVENDAGFTEGDSYHSRTCLIPKLESMSRWTE